MSRMGIIVSVDECIGCHACFIACKQENQVSPNIQWNRIRKVENREKNIINYFRASCQHCEDPACLKVCPMKAVYKGPHGEILIDQDKCIACKACLAACPYGMPMFNDQKHMDLSLPLTVLPPHSTDQSPLGTLPHFPHYQSEQNLQPSSPDLKHMLDGNPLNSGQWQSLHF